MQQGSVPHSTRAASFQPQHVSRSLRSLVQNRLRGLLSGSAGGVGLAALSNAAAARLSECNLRGIYSAMFGAGHVAEVTDLIVRDGHSRLP